jgi:alcohol dehydrogenase
LQEKMSPAGRICTLSDDNVEPLALTPAFHEKEFSVVGSSDGWDYQEHARWFFDAVGRDEGPRLGRIFELEAGFDELPHLFGRMAAGEVSPVKVLVRY